MQSSKRLSKLSFFLLPKLLLAPLSGFNYSAVMEKKHEPQFHEGLLGTFTFEFLGSPREFTVFKSENQILTVKEIFSGKTFPAPPIDRQTVDCVLDIGGNIGAASLFFAISYPNAQIHVFEPNPWTIPVLERNIKDIDRITHHPFGLFDHDKETEIEVAGFGGECSSIKQTMNPFASHPIELRKAGRVLPELTEGAQSIIVKVDTEGCEAEILEEISSILPRVQVVYLEYHSENQRRRIDRFLTDHGMMVFQAASARPHRGDVFYIREEIIAAIPYLDCYRTD